jgi:hypothetical protein
MSLKDKIFKVEDRRLPRRYYDAEDVHAAIAELRKRLAKYRRLNK